MRGRARNSRSIHSPSPSHRDCVAPLLGTNPRLPSETIPCPRRQRRESCCGYFDRPYKETPLTSCLTRSYYPSVLSADSSTDHPGYCQLIWKRFSESKAGTVDQATACGGSIHIVTLKQKLHCKILVTM